VDIAYIPFVERFHIVFSKVFKHDLTEGRPKLAAWIEVQLKQFSLKLQLSIIAFVYELLQIKAINPNLRKTSSVQQMEMEMVHGK